MIALTIVLLLFVGCVLPGNGKENSVQSLKNFTIPQDSNSHPDYVKMEKEQYTAGETVKFTVVNEEPGSMMCANNVPSYRIDYLMGNGTFVGIFRPTGVIQPGITYLRSGESSALFSFVTTNWSPGIYQIIFDCGGVNRKFEILKNH